MKTVEIVDGEKGMKKRFKIEDKKPIPQEIADRLYAYIKKNDFWGKRLPSQRDLCKLLDTGLVSVNKAIKILQDTGVVISYPKRGCFVASQAIEEKESIKRKKLLIISYWGKRTLTSRFKDDLIKFTPLINECENRNIDIIFAKLNDPGDEKNILKDYPPESTDYVVFNSVYEYPDLVKYISTHYKYSLTIDHYFERIGITGILDNGVEGTQKVTQHLIQLGHERIVFLDHSDVNVNPWKRKGFLKTLEKSKIESTPDSIINCARDIETIKEVVYKYLDSDSPPTAFVCFDDFRAINVIKALRERSIEVGKDVAVTGYGNLAFERGLSQEITSIKVDESLMGEYAIKYLFENTPKKPGSKILISTELIIRSSSTGQNSNSE